MRVPEEPVCIDLFRQKPVFTSLHLKYPVHVVPPLQSEFGSQTESKKSTLYVVFILPILRGGWVCIPTIRYMHRVSCSLNVHNKTLTPEPLLLIQLPSADVKYNLATL